MEGRAFGLHVEPRSTRQGCGAADMQLIRSNTRSVTNIGAGRGGRGRDGASDCDPSRSVSGRRAKGATVAQRASETCAAPLSAGDSSGREVAGTCRTRPRWRPGSGRVPLDLPPLRMEVTGPRVLVITESRTSRRAGFDWRLFSRIGREGPCRRQRRIHHGVRRGAAAPSTAGLIERGCAT